MMMMMTTITTVKHEGEHVSINMTDTMFPRVLVFLVMVLVF